MDPVVRARADMGLDFKAADFHALTIRREAMMASTRDKLEEVDAILSPMALTTSPTAAEMQSVETALRISPRLGQNSHPVNLMGVCASTQPIQMLTGAALPIGLQVICPAFEEGRLLSTAGGIEALIGAPPVADLAGFTRG
jgi:aspartyl-tRNA(Asn)/glutamyl-tRNA(Gln) amidotransferase subunit A